MSHASNAAHWLDHFSSSEVVARYAADVQLQPPEQTIFNLLAPGLRQARVLDLGVGAGRTTRTLVPMCRSYVGADFAEPMVAACRQRFANWVLNQDIHFEVIDARSIPFESDSFDMVCFSRNGIDLVSPEDREQVLAECRRVLKPGGRLVYSSHNLNWLASRRGLRWAGLGPYVRSHLHWSGVRRLNDGLFPLRDRQFALVHEAPGRPGVYYARPEVHALQAHRHGFSRVRAFDMAGHEVVDDTRFRGLTDAWIYYLCED